MGQLENEIKNKRFLSLKPNQRRHKINAGQAWQGEFVKPKTGKPYIKYPRAIKLGPKGWPDLWGFDSIVITPDMVGQTIAVFATDEIKAEGDRFSSIQLKIKKFLEDMGVIYTVLE